MKAVGRRCSRVLSCGYDQMDPEDLPGWAATPASYSAPSTPNPGEDMEDGEAAAVLVNSEDNQFEIEFRHYRVVNSKTCFQLHVCLLIPYPASVGGCGKQNQEL